MPSQLSELFRTSPSVSYSGTIAIASLILGSACIVSYLRWRRRVASYPPGPPPDPILGNIRQLVKINNQERTFANWERLYGLLPITDHRSSSATSCLLLIRHFGQRRHQLLQRFQQVNFDPQLHFGRKGSPREAECDLFQSSDTGHDL